MKTNIASKVVITQVDVVAIDDDDTKVDVDDHYHWLQSIIDINFCGVEMKSPPQLLINFGIDDDINITHQFLTPEIDKISPIFGPDFSSNFGHTFCHDF